MNNRYIRKPSLWVIILGFVIVYVLTVITWPSRTSSQRVENQGTQGANRVEDNGNVRINNRTRGLSVVSLNLHSEDVEVVMKNNYDKSITAYQVYVGNTTVQTVLLTGDVPKIIAPGELIHENYARNLGLDTRGVVILAVVFDDKTGDGDAEYVRGLLEYNEGMKMQRLYSLEVLQNILKSQNSIISPALNKLQSAVSPLSEDEINKLQQNVQFGIRDEQKRLLRIIQRDFRDRNDVMVQPGEDKEIYLKQRVSSLVENYKQSLQYL